MANCFVQIKLPASHASYPRSDLKSSWYIGTADGRTGIRVQRANRKAFVWCRHVEPFDADREPLFRGGGGG